MGTKGDQDLDKQNKGLADQPTSGVVVHLFEVFSQGRYTYAGRVALIGEVSREKQPDAAGILRDVYVFPLKLDAGAPPEPTTEEITRIRETRQRKLRTKTVEELRVLALAGGRSTPGRRDARTTQFDRDQSVIEYVKKAAAGICDLCHEPAPFNTTAGPYLEGHHVQPLAEGGPDIIENAVAICPNCHRKVHVLKSPKDLGVLLARIKARERPLVIDQGPA
jgi:5-methylcytosine-specific restriction protein A